MESPGWFAVSTPARSMLLMVAMVIRVLKTSHAAPSIDTCTKLAAKELMGNIQQIRSRQISTPAATQQLPSAQLKALRTSLLLLKPACLLTSAQTQVSGLPIWSAAASSCVKAYKHGRDTSSRQRAAEAAEVLNLTIHLVQMTVSALKRFIAVKTSAVTAAVPYCCQLLTCLMPEDQPTLHKAVATELIQSGMVVLVAALALEREVAVFAFGVIYQKLVCPELLPEVASSAEEALLRYQAVPRLCKLLRPVLPALPVPEADPDKDAALRRVKWLKGTGLKQIPNHARIASVLSRLLKRSPPSADPHQALPTPTAAVWESMHICVEMLLMAKSFFAEMQYTPCVTNPAGVDPIAEGISTLHKDMAELPYNLVGGHLPNLSLDVTQLMRSTLTAILIQDVVIMAGTPSASLLLAYLRRLARDPSVLHLEPEDIKPTAQGRLRHMPKGKVCQGCEECNSPVWLFKVRNGAALWAQACYGASYKTSHTIAAAAIDALHTALLDPEQCKHLLLNTYQVTGPTIVEGSLHAAINGLKACPPAQMMAGACLARLCTEEVKRVGDGAADKMPWLSKALQEGTFQLVYDGLQKSVQVRMPHAAFGKQSRNPVPYQDLDETSRELAFVLTDTLLLPCIDPTNEASKVSSDNCVRAASRAGGAASTSGNVQCHIVVNGSSSRSIGLCLSSWAAGLTLPYLAVLEKWSHWGPEDCAKPPPAEAAQLTLQVLYKLVQTFSKQQVSIKEKTPVRMASSQRQAASQEAASLEQAAEATRALIDSTLEAYERMRDDRQWAAVIAEEENSWFAHKEQAAAAFKRELSTLSRGGTRLLPASVARRLLACFSPLVLDQPDKTEASAETAFNEL
ncbi:TPA: hypothetical protein ACH3X3_002300 [Trebouxia sp. C0006]